MVFKQSMRFTSAARPSCLRLHCLFFVIFLWGINVSAFAEGTRQLEPLGAPDKSFCKLVLMQNPAEFRIPFALFHCSAEYRLNIRINDFNTEKIYLGFGHVIDYFYDSVVYHDVSFVVRDPLGNIVAGDSTLALPEQGNGYIQNAAEAYAGPQRGTANPGGYKPLVISPLTNGDYYIEFKIPPFRNNEIRTFKYFDVTVANPAAEIKGRLWSKAWQLASGDVSSGKHASYALFYILTNDSIVTRFDCNGLAGGVWNIYSNEWGCATTGSWLERRHSAPGNAAILPEYKIFLNDPDSLVFPSGHIGKLNEYQVLNTDCDTVVTFAANVSKAGNIEVLVDVPPLNPGTTGPEDVKLVYPVKPGYNVLLPAWNGKNGLGQAVANNTVVTSSMRFVSGLTNLPLYDVEDNPNGFKVDLQRPLPANTSPKMQLFWDDTFLPNSSPSSANITGGCVYTGVNPVSGCHAWNYVNNQSLGDTNTINTWWYLTSESVQSIPITLKIKPSSGHISGPKTICSGQNIEFRTSSIAFAKQYIWNVTGPGFSHTDTIIGTDSAFNMMFSSSLIPGNYQLSVFGRNPQCLNGDKVTNTAYVYNYIPPPVSGAADVCANTSTEYILQGSFSNVVWNIKNGDIVSTAEKNRISVNWHIAGTDTLKVMATTAECGTRPASLPVHVAPVAEAAFAPAEGITACPGMKIAFTDLSHLASGAVVARAWDWGNGFSRQGNDSLFTYAFPAAGIFPVSLKVKTDQGCETAASRQVRIIPFPVADFSVSANCLSQAVQFNDQSSGIDVSLWKWDFGTAPRTAVNLETRKPDVVFNTLGKFQVKLVAGNAYGCFDSVTKQVEIHHLPHAAFVNQNPCRATGIVFTDQSSAADTALAQFTWQVYTPSGYSRTYTGNPVTMVFDETNQYTVKHTVTDGFGCTDTAVSVVQVKPKPNAGFEYTESPGNTNATLQVNNLTSGADSYAWDFGNGSTSELVNPAITYDKEGTYSIRLIAKNAENCNDTATVQYFYLPGFWMPNAFTPNRDGHNDQLRPVTQRTTMQPYSFSVYNRWGQLLFCTHDPAKGWDGTYNGHPCETGSYTFIIQFNKGNNETPGIATQRGVVTLIR